MNRTNNRGEIDATYTPQPQELLTPRLSIGDITPYSASSRAPDANIAPHSSPPCLSCTLYDKTLIQHPWSMIFSTGSFAVLAKYHQRWRGHPLLHTSRARMQHKKVIPAQSTNSIQENTNRVAKRSRYALRVIAWSARRTIVEGFSGWALRSVRRPALALPVLLP